MVVITGRSLFTANGIGYAPRFLEIEAPGDRSSAFAVMAGTNAWVDSRCDADPNRIGSTVTASKLGIGGGTNPIERMVPRLNPDFVRGPVVTSVSACATGLSSWIRGAALLENDEADAVLAGAAEGALTELVIAGFRRMGVLSTSTPRPFDRRRDGFVPSEGAGVVVLEREADARARGARIFGRLLSWVQGIDAGHPLDSEPAAISGLVTKALHRAKIDSADLSYIHLHGTGTINNDRSEARVLQLLFDRNDLRIPASSTKGATGHCLGAAGAVEAILTLNALAERCAPATTGLEEIDEECRSDCLVFGEETINGSIGLVLSYGFGGHMAAIVMEAL